MKKRGILRLSPEKLAFMQLTREAKKKVEKEFRKLTDCSRSNFYDKISGRLTINPLEKRELHKLLKIKSST